CDREIKTGKTRDLNKHMNLNGNLRKGQCLPALRLMQNPHQAPVVENPPENPAPIPTQNTPPVPIPEGDLISFDGNPPMHQPAQPREENALAVDPGIGSSTKQNSVSYQDRDRPSLRSNKTILIHKNVPNGFEFYDGKRK
ncbi:1393_t:CDS:1, partial [Paraglomus occultum]